MAKIPQTRSSNKTRTVYNVLADGEYEARIVRFVGLGVQEQPIYDGQKKDPAFKCAIQFELIGVDATGTVFENDADIVGKPIDPRPACQFKDFYLFPGAKRGNIFDLCQMIDPSLTAVPEDLDWFTQKMLGAVVNLKVGSYAAKDGTRKNTIVKNGIMAIPEKYKAGVGPARCDLVGFDPYVDSPTNAVAYAKLFKFQREDLAKAHDAVHIPYAGKEPIKLGEGQQAAPAATTATAGTTAAVADNSYDEDAPF